MPMTKSIATMTIMYAAMTGFGIASSRARALGRKATAMRMDPAATPRPRAATPVSSASETPVV